MLRAFKRLTKLEQALNDHMVKEREKELAAYDRMTERYKEEQKAEEDEFRRLHPEATDLQVFLHIIDCGYGPRLYNPPLSARVKYIVVE